MIELNLQNAWTVRFVQKLSAAFPRPGLIFNGSRDRRVGVADAVTYLYIKAKIALENPTLALRLPEEIEHRLQALAKATGRTKTFYARQAILEHIDDLEDLYLAKQRLMEIRAGREKTIPFAEAVNKYGLAD